MKLTFPKSLKLCERCKKNEAQLVLVDCEPHILICFDCAVEID